MQIFAFLFLIIAGCSLDDVPEVEVPDAGLQGPDAAGPQAPMADLLRDASVVLQSDARAELSTEMVPPGSARQADSGIGSVALPMLDAGTSAAGALPSSTDALSSADRRCLPGTYQGSLASLVLLGVPPPESVSGTITLKLATISGQDQLSMTGEFDGVLSNNGLISATSTLEVEIRAVLDCATHQLHDGLLISTDGGTEITVGMLQGAYSDSPPSFSGTWTAGGLLFGLSGDWSASAQTNNDAGSADAGSADAGSAADVGT